jgi:acyl-coenzyme A synthetase/AMP-(fatty) acid ligase
MISESNQANNLETLSESDKRIMLWGRELQDLYWDVFPDQILNENNPNESSLPKWFPYGKLNIAYNCLVHNKNPEDRALYYFNTFNNLSGYLTYGQLTKKVNQMSSVLKSLGIQKNDRVLLAMSNSVEFVVSTLACLQIGAIFHAIPSNNGVQRIKYKINSINPKLVVVNSCEGKSVLTVSARERSQANQICD